MSDIQPKKPQLLKLVDFDNSILRQAIEPVHFPLSAVDKQYIEDMKYSIQPEQLKAADAPWESAAGMAANQWGLNKRIFLFCPDKEIDLEVIINPHYEPLAYAAEQLPNEDLSWEGCFSVPLATGNVKRYTDIRATYQNEAGETITREMHGRNARVFQHETDHLNGLLYYELNPTKCIDKRKFSSREAVDKFYDLMHQKQKLFTNKSFKCPCGSGKILMACCGPYLRGEQLPPTPEALMRSRYTAYSLDYLEYIVATMRGPALAQFYEPHEARIPVEWVNLKVIKAYYDAVDPNVGYVEFIAKYKKKSIPSKIHELSKFHREEGRWYYVDGEHFVRK